METITWDDFEKVEMLTGTVLSAEPLEGARKPAYKLKIDAGEKGELQSSAQITEHYEPDELIGKQVVVVANFPPKRIAGYKSECLVMGVSHESGGVVLLCPDKPVPNGQRVF